MSSDPRAEAVDPSITEDRFAALETRVDTLIAQLDCRSTKRETRDGRFSRIGESTSSRPRRFAALVVAVAVLLPLAALASDRFPDVPNSNVHHDNITAIANAGITAGCAGGNYCPADLVRRDQMASFLARGLALGPGKLAVANAKGSFPTYCKLAADRPETFMQGPCYGSRSTVATANNTGRDPSIAIGTDGNPVIAYLDSTGSDLHVARCSDPACTGAPSIVVPDFNGGVTPSLAIGIDGNPVISYTHNVNSNLRVAACVNPTCAGAVTLTAVDTAPAVGLYTSLSIGTDGNPVIAYFDSTNLDLKVAKCADPACTGAATVTTVDAEGSVGQFPSLAIGADGIPLITYRADSGASLKLAVCADPTCAGSATVTTLDNSADLGRFSSIAIGTDGNPVISYLDGTNADLKVAKCVDPTCTGATTFTAVDTAGNVGSYTSITIGLDGNPVISYHDDSNGDLKVARCGNPACTGTANITTVDSEGTVGRYTSITTGVDGNVVVAYFDVTQLDLNVARLPVNF